MTLITSQLVLIRRGGGRRAEEWRLVTGSRNVQAICNRKKVRLTFIKDVPGTWQAAKRQEPRVGKARLITQSRAGCIAHNKTSLSLSSAEARGEFFGTGLPLTVLPN